MSKENYLDDFLDNNDLSLEQPKSKVLPDWVSRDNSSYAVYQAILLLEVEKISFIKKHKLKSEYKKKSNFEIKKSEVARIVGKNAQPLFNSNSYSEELLFFFDETNQNLVTTKEARINAPKSGVGNMRKEDLVVEHKSLLQSHDKSKLQCVDDIYQKFLDNIPLDVKRKLKLG
jgi:hypothetical protein